MPVYVRDCLSRCIQVAGQVIVSSYEIILRLPLVKHAAVGLFLKESHGVEVSRPVVQATVTVFHQKSTRCAKQHVQCPGLW